MPRTIAPCEITRLQSDIMTGGVEMVISIPKDQSHAARIMAKNLMSKKLTVTAVEYRNKRSLDANAYAWELLGKLADKLTAGGGAAYSKDDMYLIMLKRYGQGGIVKIPNKDVEKFKRTWKYCEEHEKLYDENSAYYRFWVGSSNYDTQEMSLFINGIVDECKEQGIETLPPERLEAMRDEWAKTNALNN